MFALVQTLVLSFGLYGCSELLEPNRNTFSRESEGLASFEFVSIELKLDGHHAETFVLINNRYEFLEKLLERSIMTDIQMQEYNKADEKALDSIKDHNQEFEGLKDGILQVVTELKAAMENQIQLLEQVVQNVTQLQERLLIPTVQFSVKGVRDLSPNQNEVIIFPTVLQNIGNAYNPGTGVFTAPTNGTYTFSMQACTVNSRFAYFQLVVDSSDTVILVIRNYENTAATTTSDSVPHSLTVGKRVWIQSHFNSGITNMLYHNEPTCCNHFSGVLVNS